MQNLHGSLPEPNRVLEPPHSRVATDSRVATERVPPPEVLKPEVLKPPLPAAADAGRPAAGSSLDSPWLEFWRRIHALALEIDAGAGTKADE